MAALSKAMSRNRPTSVASSSLSTAPLHRDSALDTNARPAAVADWLKSAAKAAQTLGTQSGSAPASGDAARVITYKAGSGC
jgi:hypothetical protein